MTKKAASSIKIEFQKPLKPILVVFWKLLEDAISLQSFQRLFKLFNMSTKGFTNSYVIALVAFSKIIRIQKTFSYDDF